MLSQLQFPGMPEREAGPYKGERTAPPADVTPYTSAHTMYKADPDAAFGWSGDRVNLVPPTGDDYYTYANRWTTTGRSPIPQSTERQDFIPTDRVTSDQDWVNHEAVDHMVQNANPLALHDDPSVYEYPGSDGRPKYDLNDGNHRTNAALRRGQLLMPATVSADVR
jgi:hypothetical protein